MTYDFKVSEPAMLQFWADEQIYEKAVKKNLGKKKFYYLDGPPYTTGKIHIGHAWGRALRDSIMRFKRMNDFDVWDRPGFDMHGLPIEVSVEKELGIKTKSEIVNKIGMQKFIEACEKYALDNLWPMIEDFKRLGVWMNWKDPYMSIKNEYIEGAWWALAKAHEKKLLYLGKKAMTWCPRCATALAKHELEYANRKEDSVFVKLQVQNKPNEFLIVWTTTPWTMPFNLAVMVHPKYDYVRVQVGKEVWIVADVLAEKVMQIVKNDNFKILETVKGESLAGIKYDHPYSELAYHKNNKEKNAYRVILSEKYVSVQDGTGLVHCAPGCGPEDFEVGKVSGIAAYNSMDEHGVFPGDMGAISGLVAKTDDAQFIQLLEDKKVLAAKLKVEHEYAHCWRCKTPVIYRATDQWFLAVESLKEKMVEENKKVQWVPAWAGNRQFDSWLKSLQDWCISRQRFWGIPLPIWKCECGKHKVVGTREELKKVSGKELKNLHRPWIDEVLLSCECGKQMRRVPDVLDVWLDSGVAPWATLQFPTNEKKFKELGFPNLILEGKDQIRGWFNSLMCMSMVSLGKVPYTAVYMHGFINDSQGRKMSKSLKNFITPYEIIDVFGADTMRYYQIGGAQPGLDLNFNHEDAKTKHRNLIVLWNVQNFVRDLAKELKQDPKKLDAKVMRNLFGVEEKFMFSKLNSVILEVTTLFNEYRLNEVPGVIEDLFLTISRTYIQLVREKAAVGDDTDRQVVLYTIYTCLLECLKLFAPIAPLLCEQIYQNLKEDFKLEEESIHLCAWPKEDKKLIDKKLEEQIAIVDEVVQSILAGREKVKLSVRWPLKVVHVVSQDEQVLAAVEELEDIIKLQTNCKEVHGHKEFSEVKRTIKPNAGPLGKQFGSKSPKIMVALAKEDGSKILLALAKDAKYSLQVEKEKVEINKEHIVVECDVPKKYTAVSFRKGDVYLDGTRTDELDAEGFAREIMRRSQQLRKDAGLQKSNKISLYVQTEEELAKSLASWIEQIKLKCGASVAKIGSQNPARKHEHSAEEQIKDKSIRIFLDKVSES